MPEDNTNLKLIPEIVDKINNSKNILIALSSNPSVDEMASAIGLSLFLDKLGKRATAIYSGATPNALEFLKPEDTFEPTVDAIQDFVIALNKDKADHLRYKLDGDFVKIYITPYKTRIAEEDLDFSYGDYNIDLVFALDVANGVDLDSALREYGRIMHDAVIINITTGNPGKLGEIEWSDKKASSVAEMLTTLVYSMGDVAKMEKDEATAFLTGIVAATNRFSNAKTTAESMRAASRLMESGANQQLISKNITADTQNEIFNMMNGAKKDKTPTPPQEKSQEKPEEKPEENPEENSDDVLDVQQEGSELLDDLKAAEENLAQTSADTVAPAEEPAEEPTKEPAAPTAPAAAPAEEPATDPTEFDVQNAESFVSDKPEKILQPSTDDFAESLDSPEQENKYGQMLEDALSSAQEPTTAPTMPTSMPTTANPAAASAPIVPTSPEINGVPQMNYMPLPGDQVLPPPPTPPIDMASVPPAQPVAQEPAPVVAPAMPLPAAPTAEPTAPAEVPVAPPTASVEAPVQAPTVAPVAPTAPTAPAAPADPSAFQIPGM